jgi:hypothetical protein
MNSMLLQKAIDYLLSGSKLLIQFLRTRIQIPVFVLIVPIVFGAVYYFKFRKETKKMQEIATRTISTNADLRLKISADSIHIIQLQNEKQRIINYHFQYIGNLGKMSDAELQSELNRQFE